MRLVKPVPKRAKIHARCFCAIRFSYDKYTVSGGKKRVARSSFVKVTVKNIVALFPDTV